MAGTSPYKVGDVIGNREIVEYCGSDPKFRVSLWKYKCILCGTISGPVRTSTLTRRNASSVPACCRSKKVGKASSGWKGYEDIPLTYLTQIEYGAKKRKIPYAVTPKQLWSIWRRQDGRCALSGLPLKHGEDASLDRIDSDLGYTCGNLQWVHKDINRMKSNFTDEEFVRLCELVYLYQLPSMPIGESQPP